MAINLQKHLEEAFEDFPEYADVLERSKTEWLVSADVHEILRNHRTLSHETLRNHSSLSFVCPAPYATGLFLCEPTTAASDQHAWESVKLLTTKEKDPLYYRRYTLSLSESSRYEKRVYRPYENCGAVVLHLRIIDLPQETSGDETDNSSASVDYGYRAGYESSEDFGFPEFGANANDDGLKTENGKLAECSGLDPSKYGSRPNDAMDSDPCPPLATTSDEEKVADTPKMAINLQKHLEEAFEDFPEYADVLERSKTEWLVSADVHEILRNHRTLFHESLRNHSSLSFVCPAPYATGLFLCEPTTAASDQHAWESVKLLTTKEKDPLYYRRYTLSLSESSRYEKRVYRPYENCGAVVLHLRIIDLPQETSGDETDNSSASVDYGYRAGYESSEDFGFPEFGANANDDGLKTENGKLAECSGLDPSKYGSRPNDAMDSDPCPPLATTSDEEKVADTPKMAINLQKHLEEAFEDFPEYADVLERSKTEWLVSADVHEILRNHRTLFHESLRNHSSLSFVCPAPYATGLFLCEPTTAASDQHAWESVKLLTTKEKDPLYYRRYTLSLSESSRYEKRVYRPYENCGAVVLHLRIIDLPQETSGDETDNSSASVDYGYRAGYESSEDFGFPEFGANANDDGLKTENGKLAECSGLDPSKYGSRPNDAMDSDPCPPLATTSDEEKVADTPKMAINLQKHLEEAFEDFPEYADVLERSKTEWLVSADVHEILRNHRTLFHESLRNHSSLSFVCPAPYATGLFLCEPTTAASDQHAWESVKLLTTKEKDPLYYRRYTLSLSESSRYEKRVYRPYENCGAVVLHLRIIDLPQETSGDETDNSSASVDYGYRAGYESSEDFGFPEFGANANDDGLKTENGKLAECSGLDPSKYGSRPNDAMDSDPCPPLATTSDEEKVADTPKMAINLQKHLEEAFEDFPEYADVLERSKTEWLVSADVHEILRNHRTLSHETLRNHSSLSFVCPAPYATGLFLCEPTTAASDQHAWESVKLLTTKEKDPLYYRRYTLSLSESSRYEKRVYRPYENCGAVVLHLRIIDLPQETSGDETDNSSASVDYGYRAGYESPEGYGFSD